MAVFSTNQNRQLYVAKRYADGSTVPLVGSANSQPGDIQAKCINNGMDKEIFFTYQGADTPLRSDRISLKNLDYVKLVKAWDMVTPMTIKVVTLSGDVNGGLPKAGEDYIIRIVLRQFHGMSDADLYIKDAAVHVTSAMASGTAAQQKQAFYEAMADALNRSFSREVGATKDSNPYLKFESSANALTIWELPQAWNLGTEAVQRVHFEVQPTTIFDGLEDVIWGNVEDKTYELYRDDGNGGLEPAVYDNNIEGNRKGIIVGYGRNATGTGNGRAIADLEWFCMGERGDQYRNIGWPNTIPTTYLVDPNFQYNVLELHFAFTDTGVNSYRSEKDITIVAPDNVNGKAAINELVDFLNTNAGTELTKLE